MRLKYEKTLVTGWTAEGRTVREEIIHLENQDPLLMAMRRNGRLTDCPTVTTRTVEAFTRHVDTYPHAGRKDIPIMRNGYLEYDW